MGIMEATVRSRSDEMRDTVGIIQAMAAAENQAGTNFDSLPIGQQTATLRAALDANSRSGPTLTERFNPREAIVEDGVDGQGYAGVQRGPDLDPVTISANRDFRGGFISTAANVLDRGSAAVAAIIDNVGPDNAEWAVGGIQLAIGGIPKTAISFAVNSITEKPIQFLNTTLSGMIAQNAFDVDDASSDRAVEINKVSGALGSFGVSAAIGTAAGVIRNVGNTRDILNTVPWSSKSVNNADRALSSGASAVQVATRSEAEELMLGRYAGAGYKNATGMDGVGTKQLFGQKEGTYHWDDKLGPDGRVLGHGPTNPDGDMRHLQIHPIGGGSTIRIFFPE